MVFWSAVFHQVQDSPYSYSEFIDQFVYPVSCLLMKVPPPRITYEMQKILQLSKNYKLGDWYLYQDHTVIRVYGCELDPYRMPRYVLMRLFALEYFRQFGNADLVHFHSENKKVQLKVRNQLCRFLYNKREEGWKEVDMILESLQLETRFRWVPYDPNHFISLRRVKHKLGGYTHIRLPHIEKYANLLSWKEGTLEEAFTREKMLQREAKNIEKEADLETCGQFSSSHQRQLGVVASSSTAHQQAAKATY